MERVTDWMKVRSGGVEQRGWKCDFGSFAWLKGDSVAYSATLCLSFHIYEVRMAPTLPGFCEYEMKLCIQDAKFITRQILGSIVLWRSGVCVCVYLMDVYMCVWVHVHIWWHSCVSVLWMCVYVCTTCMCVHMTGAGVWWTRVCMWQTLHMCVVVDPQVCIFMNTKECVCVMGSRDWACTRWTLWMAV
jgi:hypothetical protein